mmetsp:Transcript_61419/g.123104  ORF Transcript_61419/g.123104 Transcript_61419/m.123104 type:complete len:228 (+) Transcript_61419:573-1256(+)
MTTWHRGRGLPMMRAPLQDAAQQCGPRQKLSGRHPTGSAARAGASTGSRRPPRPEPQCGLQAARRGKLMRALRRSRLGVAGKLPPARPWCLLLAQPGALPLSWHARAAPKGRARAPREAGSRWTTGLLPPQRTALRQELPPARRPEPELRPARSADHPRHCVALPHKRSVLATSGTIGWNALPRGSIVSCGSEHRNWPGRAETPTRCSQPRPTPFSISRKPRCRKSL